MDSSYHEPVSEISPEARDMHRALRSLIEELDAIDWYVQRIEATPDAELRSILAHNRDEEIEHASMILEWIRRRSAKFDDDLHTYLFTTSSITEVEAATEAGSAIDDATSDGSLGIGSLNLRRRMPAESS